MDGFWWYIHIHSVRKTDLLKVRSLGVSLLPRPRHNIQLSPCTLPSPISRSVVLFFIYRIFLQVHSS